MSRTLPVALLTALYAAWALPLLPWVGRSLLERDGSLRALVVLLGLAASVRAPQTSDRPTALPLAWVTLPALIAPLFPSLQTVQVLLLVASGYGLSGLWLSPARWRALGPLAALIALAVPASIWLDVTLGWPLRKLIASAAAVLLGGVPVETVIRVEGGVAHVDLPCAGVRSLWTLGAVMLLWALARGRGLDLRWFVAALVASFGALAANTVRVVILVGLAHVWGLPLVADTVHVPLGVVGFVMAMAAGISAGEWRTKGVQSKPVRQGSPARPWKAWLAAGALLVALLGQGSAEAPQERTVAAPVPAGWSEIEPTAIERSFAWEHGASVTKAKGPQGASVVLVASQSWLAHHVPEQCLLAHGWRIDEDHPTWIDGVPVRQAQVRKDGQKATAIWWFQRGEEVTDDLVVRIRSGGRWVLVSMLVPGEAPQGDLVGFLQSVRQAAAAEET